MDRRAIRRARLINYERVHIAKSMNAAFEKLIEKAKARATRVKRIAKEFRRPRIPKTMHLFPPIPENRLYLNYPLKKRNNRKAPVINVTPKAKPKATKNPTKFFLF